MLLRNFGDENGMLKTGFCLQLVLVAPTGFLLALDWGRAFTESLQHVCYKYTGVQLFKTKLMQLLQEYRTLNPTISNTQGEQKTV